MRQIYLCEGCGHPFTDFKRYGRHMERREGYSFDGETLKYEPEAVGR